MQEAATARRPLAERRAPAGSVLPCLPALVRRAAAAFLLLSGYPPTSRPTSEFAERSVDTPEIENGVPGQGHPSNDKIAGAKGAGYLIVHRLIAAVTTAVICTLTPNRGLSDSSESSRMRAR